MVHSRRKYWNLPLYVHWDILLRWLCSREGYIGRTGKQEGFTLLTKILDHSAKWLGLPILLWIFARLNQKDNNQGPVSFIVVVVAKWLPATATAHADLKTDLTNNRMANWAPEAVFSPFRALSGSHLMVSQTSLKKKIEIQKHYLPSCNWLLSWSRKIHFKSVIRLQSLSRLRLCFWKSKQFNLSSVYVLRVLIFFSANLS